MKIIRLIVILKIKSTYHFKYCNGIKRAWLGFCPLCNSDSPELYDCPICVNDRIDDYGTINSTMTPTKHQLQNWRQTYLMTIKAKAMVSMMVMESKIKRIKR